MGVVDAAVFRPSGLHGDPRGRSAKPVKGQRGPEVTGDDELGRRRGSPAWRSRRRSAPSRGKVAARVVRRAGGWRDQGGAGRVKRAVVAILGVRAAEIAARRLRGGIGIEPSSDSGRVL